MNVETTLALADAEMMIRALHRPATKTDTLRRYLTHVDAQIADLRVSLQKGAPVGLEFCAELKAITVLTNVRYELEAALSRRTRNEQ